MCKYTETLTHLVRSMCKYLLLWALVSSIVGCSTQVQGLVGCCHDALPCGGGGGFSCLCDLNALCCDGFLLILELECFLPTVS